MTDVAQGTPRYGLIATELGASETSHRLYARQREVEQDRVAASAPYASPSDIFGELATEWRAATRLSSSAMQITAHPAYLRIIGLGRRVLPLILRELARGTDHWFVALSAVAGEDPIPLEAWGDLDAMREAWLQWARERNLL